MKLILVAGARPNFMKIAPLIRALNGEFKVSGLGEHTISWRLVHTGQHYDYDMSKIFFKELDIPGPDFFLDVGSGTHAEQTAKVMVEFEKFCLDETPDVVLPDFTHEDE